MTLFSLKKAGLVKPRGEERGLVRQLCHIKLLFRMKRKSTNRYRTRVMNFMSYTKKLGVGMGAELPLLQRQ